MTAKQFEQFVNLLLNTYGYNSINPTTRIIGRGTTHQIDALGINKLTPTFSYPITLLAEAKYYRNDKIVGIEILRNFYGVLSDVGQSLPRNFTIPKIEGNLYTNGTSNITGLIISTVGFSSFAKGFAYSHGIFLVTVNFIKRNHSPLFANFGGQPVIIQVPDDLKFDMGLKEMRTIKLAKLSGKKEQIFIEKYPIQGKIKLIKKITYNNNTLKYKQEFDNEESVNCFMYDIIVPSLKSKFRTISQFEITDFTLLTIELPQSMTYLTIEIKL